MRILLITLAVLVLSVVGVGAQTDSVEISENCTGESFTDCTYSIAVEDPTDIEATTWSLWLCTDRDESGECLERDRQTRLHVGPDEGGYQAFDTSLKASWHGYDVTVRVTHYDSTQVLTDTYRIPRVRGGTAADGFSVPSAAIEACATGDIVGCIRESAKTNSVLVGFGVLAVGVVLYLGLQPGG